ncbi:hypothetical protein GGR56DRAFT_388996 [Xylariaceae sp. FL0804]|nr:hypothetical protein GGR56DRAFT_388996 [Xylariaceae sp. FL0804]
MPGPFAIGAYDPRNQSTLTAMADGDVSRGAAVLWPSSDHTFETASDYTYNSASRHLMHFSGQKSDSMQLGHPFTFVAYPYNDRAGGQRVLRGPPDPHVPARGRRQPRRARRRRLGAVRGPGCDLGGQRDHRLHEGRPADLENSLLIDELGWRKTSSSSIHQGLLDNLWRGYLKGWSETAFSSKQIRNFIPLSPDFPRTTKACI